MGTPVEKTNTSSITPQVSGENVSFGPGVTFQVTAKQDVNLANSKVFSIAAGRDTQMTNTTNQVLVAGRSITVNNSTNRIAVAGHDIELGGSGAWLMKAGGGIHLADSQVSLLAGNQVNVQRSVVGVVLSKQTTMDGHTQVLLNTSQAIALGAAMGAVFALVNWLLRKQ